MKDSNKELIFNWFVALRDDLIAILEEIEEEYATLKNIKVVPKFKKTRWDRSGGGGGEMGIMHGNVFEKVGVNISQVYGEFDKKFAKEIPGADQDRKFFATGVSFVAHAESPFVPAAHFNTRYINTTRSWFGGGSDLTPTYPDQEETERFHNALKYICDKYDSNYYPKFKSQCDEYFYIKHRNEARGVGGIFYDYLNTGNFEHDFNFTKDVGISFLDIYPKIVKSKMNQVWDEHEKEKQLIKRGRYVEFNLLYDRGTKFGLMTNGNIDAILMSMPPKVIWK
ncbi:MAG: oxygen-dependent coproporphyrinogen oxidase [Rickettsiaceae bacterium]